MDIISAIDHATGCHQCGQDLTGSASDDFCTEACQRTWQAARVGAELELEDEAWPCGVSAATAAEYLAAVMRQVSATFTVSIPAGGQVYRSNGMEWEAFGTITSGFTFEERP